jgi:hypothetical protein
MDARPAPARAPEDGAAGEEADRYPRLVAGGLLLLLAGAACAVLVALTVLGLAMSWQGGDGASRARWSAPTLFWYSAGAAALIWTGVGSLLARRWAHAVVVAGAAVWLVKGVLSLVAALLSLRLVLRALPVMEGVAPWVRPLTAAFMIGWTALGGVLVPAMLLWLYAPRGVRLTCEQRDEGPSWTNRCPPTVLALAAALVAVALHEAVATAAGMPNLFFGRVLTGGRALAAGLLSAVLGMLVAAVVFRRKAWAFWAGLAYAGATAVSALLAVGVELAPVYGQLGLDAEWTDGAWGAYASFTSDVEAWALAVAALIWIGVLVLERRRFRSTTVAG